MDTYTALNRFIGERIRQNRKQKRLSQSGLAEMLGISYQQIQKYEYGTSRISVSRLYQVADALDEPIGLFLPKDHHALNSGETETSTDEIEAFIKKLRRKGKKKKVLEVLRELSELVG